MRVAVVCKSPLLQKSLELFLADNLSSLKHCDLVICDDKNATDKQSVYISQEDDADLRKPFTAGQLLLAIENAIGVEALSQAVKETTEQELKVVSSSIDQKVDFSILQERIEQLTQQYQEDILKAIQLFYEK
jgi:hypothetical protein